MPGTTARVNDTMSDTQEMVRRDPKSLAIETLFESVAAVYAGITFIGARRFRSMTTTARNIDRSELRAGEPGLLGLRRPAGVLPRFSVCCQGSSGSQPKTGFDIAAICQSRGNGLRGRVKLEEAVSEYRKAGATCLGNG